MTNFIKNHQQIIDYFGYWPTFHDDEIESIFLKKDGGIMEFIINPSGDKKCKVKFILGGIKEFDMKDFLNSNIVLDLSFSKKDDQIESILMSSWGVNFLVVCKNVEVTLLK